LNPYAKYKENSINTATKEELTLMLYDGCIKFMNLAKIGIEEKNIQKANDNLLKAQAIITELDVTLNMDIEISKNMHSLYDFALSRLVDANLKKDTSFIDDAKIVIVDLRDAWKEAMNIVKRGK
jgi:flagellar protein fliS